MKKFVLRQGNRLKIIQRGTIAIACVSATAVCIYITATINGTAEQSKASDGSELLSSDPLNNGSIITAFSWDSDDVLKADVGMSAISASRNAEIVTGGKDNTRGLSAGNSGKNINMQLAADGGLNEDGIDISIDFRRLEKDGAFLTRGKNFFFGMKDGKLCINYRLRPENGKTFDVEEITRYDIPADSTFRNYRFIYNAAESKAEIFVDNVAVWSNQASDGDKMAWANERFMLGEGMNGEGEAKAIFDNLVIRSTIRGRTMPMQLLSFTAELRGGEVMLNWFTGKEKGTDFFKIERSTDTYIYEEIGRVKAAGNSNELKAYALLDKRPYCGVTYYRLSLPNTDIKSVWVPVIALRIKSFSDPAAMEESNRVTK